MTNLNVHYDAFIIMLAYTSNYTVLILRPHRMCYSERLYRVTTRSDTVLLHRLTPGCGPFPRQCGRGYCTDFDNRILFRKKNQCRFTCLVRTCKPIMISPDQAVEIVGATSITCNVIDGTATVTFTLDSDLDKLYIVA